MLYKGLLWGVRSYGNHLWRFSIAFYAGVTPHPHSIWRKLRFSYHFGKKCGSGGATKPASLSFFFAQYSWTEHAFVSSCSSVKAHNPQPLGLDPFPFYTSSVLQGFQKSVLLIGPCYFPVSQVFLLRV